MLRVVRLRCGRRSGRRLRQLCAQLAQLVFERASALLGQVLPGFELGLLGCKRGSLLGQALLGVESLFGHALLGVESLLGQTLLGFESLLGQALLGFELGCKRGYALLGFESLLGHALLGFELGLRLCSLQLGRTQLGFEIGSSLLGHALLGFELRSALNLANGLWLRQIFV